MAQPTSPSPPHRSSHNQQLHVDIRGATEKIHKNVIDPLGAVAIGGFMRDQARQVKGR
jgi:hypothetical protein